MADMNIKFLGGIDKRPYATAAENIENMRYDEHRMCWKNDRSFRSWYNPDVDAVPSGEPSTGNIYSIYSYQRHRSSTQCLLFEELAGSGESLNLKVIIGQSVYTLATNRAVPRGNDPGTSYIKIGKNLFIINGEDPPLLYSGGRRIRTAFFHNTPEAPTPVEVPGTFDDNLGTQTNGDLQLRQRFGKAGINFFDNAGNLGMALAPETVTLTANNTVDEYPIQTHNCFQYAYSFISDTGAESPISPVSAQVSWHYRATGQVRNLNYSEYKHGLSVDYIPLGPPGTMKRRIYRTKNQRGGANGIKIGGMQGARQLRPGAGQELFFCGDLNDNTSTVFFDMMPDSGLGSVAPSVSDSAPIPPGLTYGAAFKNHLILAGSSENSSILYFSKGNFPEQFPAFNFFDLGSTDGGAITALYATENVCYVFRERAIDVLVPTNNLELPFRIEPLVGGIGSLSPHSIQAVPGVGLVFLGHDKKFYALSGASGDSRYAGQAGVVQLGAEIEELTESISANSLGRVVAIYSDRDKEYWAHCPVNGGRFATEGFCYHVPIKSWSRRTNIPVGCFTYLPERWVAFGSNSGLTNLPVIDGVDESSQNGGIMTWCGTLGVGYKEGPSQNRLRTTGSPDYVWETNWLDFADQNIIKRVLDITLFTYKNVSGGGSMRVGVDWKPLDYNTETQALDTNFITYNSEQTTAGVYGTAKTDQGFGAKVTNIDANRYSAREINGTRISNPFGSLQLVDGPGRTSKGEVGSGGARWWKLRFSGSQPVAIIGFQINFETPAGIKQLNFAAGDSDTNHSAMQTILGLS
jgi:hypothetical protein